MKKYVTVWFVLGFFIALPVGADMDGAKPDAKSVFSKILGAPDAAENVSGALVKIEDTKLNSIFSSATFDSSISTDTQYPRVALTVQSAPSFAVEYVSYRSEFPEGCWLISAVIWISASKSEETKFEYCEPSDRTTDMVYDTLSFWMNPTTFQFKNTGEARTIGPVPPKYSTPQDLPHTRYFGSSRLSAKTFNGVMFGQVLAKMGFDYNIRSDRRVWIVKFDQAK